MRSPKLFIKTGKRWWMKCTVNQGMFTDDFAEVQQKLIRWDLQNNSWETVLCLETRWIVACILRQFLPSSSTFRTFFRLLTCSKVCSNWRAGQGERPLLISETSLKGQVCHGPSHAILVFYKLRKQNLDIKARTLSRCIAVVSLEGQEEGMEEFTRRLNLYFQTLSSLSLSRLSCMPLSIPAQQLY